MEDYTQKGLPNYMSEWGYRNKDTLMNLFKNSDKFINVSKCQDVHETETKARNYVDIQYTFDYDYSEDLN